MNECWYTNTSVLNCYPPTTIRVVWLIRRLREWRFRRRYIAYMVRRGVPRRMAENDFDGCGYQWHAQEGATPEQAADESMSNWEG